MNENHIHSSTYAVWISANACSCLDEAGIYQIQSTESKATKNHSEFPQVAISTKDKHETSP